MSPEELSFINNSYELGLENRFERCTDLNSRLNEAYELVTRTKHRNVRMITYKFNDIDPSIIGKLRRKVLVHKVQDPHKHDRFDDKFPGTRRESEITQVLHEREA